MSLLFFMPDSIGRNGHDYDRIEHEAGGATHLAMPESNSGAIDKVTDESIASVGMMRAQMRRAYKRRKMKKNAL